MVIWETFQEKTAGRRPPIIRQLEQGGSWIRECKVARRRNELSQRKAIKVAEKKPTFKIKVAEKKPTLSKQADRRETNFVKTSRQERSQLFTDQGSKRRQIFQVK